MNYRDILSGRRRDPSAVLMRAAARVAEVPYRLVIELRNQGYDRAPGKSRAAAVPVVSVGNLTVGGTGKTPMIVYLARWFRQQGIRVSIISRGYKSDHTGVGVNDEALELEQRLPDVPHLQNPDRCAAAETAVEELETQLILLDDGFQHRRLRRDLDIVLIDATCPFGYGHLLPRGLLREPLHGLGRAHVVAITRADVVDADQLEAIEATIRRHNAAASIVHCVHGPEGLADGGLEVVEPVGRLRGLPITAFCGIGNPDAFFASLRRLGADLLHALPLPDHCRYDRPTVERIVQMQQASPGARMSVCTVKDLVKLRADELAGLPVRALSVALTIRRGEEALAEALGGVLEGCREDRD